MEERARVPSPMGTAIRGRPGDDALHQSRPLSGPLLLNCRELDRLVVAEIILGDPNLLTKELAQELMATRQIEPMVRGGTTTHSSSSRGVGRNFRMISSPRSRAVA